MRWTFPLTSRPFGRAMRLSCGLGAGMMAKLVGVLTPGVSESTAGRIPAAIYPFHQWSSMAIPAGATIKPKRTLATARASPRTLR